MLVLYVALRFALMPADVAITPAFQHDSSYIGIVARNLLAGRGYVNDANWLLFLNPESLPMYFHNANPLFPTLTAGVMGATAWDAARSAATVSILGTVLLGLGAYGIVRRFHRGTWLATGCALFAMAFPVNWRVSFAALPDALATGLMMCVLAVALHAERTWHWVVAGALFGLAWLTRSSVSLVLPGLGVWALWRFGVGTALRRGLIAGAVSAVVMSPWLLHTARVRGGPFVSDASYYLLLQYHAERTGRVEDQFYRSLSAPPSTAEVVKQDAVGVVRAAATGLPIVIKLLIAGLAEWNKLVAALLAAALLAGAWTLPIRTWRPELAGGVVIWGTLLAALAIRGESVEVRYFSVGSSLLALLMCAPIAALRTTRRWRLAPLVAYGLFGLLPQDATIARENLLVSPALEAQRTNMREAAAMLPDSAAIISAGPYFFTYFTGRQAVSPPYPGKHELLEIMRKFDAPMMMLPSDSVSYYYPGGAAALAPHLIDQGTKGRFTLFRRVTDE